MPMHPSWEKIQENFKQQYGDRWEEVFWAWMNEHGYDETEPAEGQIKGEECKKEEEDKERPPKDWFDKCVESVSKNPDVEDPEALCGWIWYHGKKEELSEEDVKKLNEEFEEERRYGRPRTDEERAMRHFGLTEEEWNELTEDEKNELISQLPPKGTGLGVPKKEEGGEEMVVEYLEQLIKEMEEALDQLENALEKKRISELPTT